MKFSDRGIKIPPGATGEIRTTCPECSPHRKKTWDTCLAVNVDEGVWFCHHCSQTGSLKNDKTEGEIQQYFDIPEFTPTGLPEKVLKWFTGRSISERTLAKHQISVGPFSSKDRTQAVKFPYVKGGQVVNVKYRTGKKKFRQEKNAEQCLYRFDEVTKNQGDTLIICEGEIDALSFYEVGYTNATSVPDGAPSAGAKEFNKKFAFLASAESTINQYKKILLCVDDDAPGKNLEQELARRIGIEKCYRVQYPDGCKDANDVLVKHGREGVAKLVTSAQPYPISGVFDVASVKDLVLHQYDVGDQAGNSTGWEELDKYYTVKTGQMTIITGIPGSGKSCFVDALLVNLTEQYDWSFALFSPENWPIQRHIQNFVEKISRKPFAKDTRIAQRVQKDEVEKILELMEAYYYFLMPENELMTVDRLLGKVKVCIYRYGIKGFVLDPWNELDHDYTGKTEAQYISESLSKIRKFARLNDIHIWVIAHPKNLIKDKDSGQYKPPTMYEISGGANWRNKADVGICVHRSDMQRDETDVLVQKVRFKEIGKLGGVCLAFNRDTGTYNFLRHKI